MRQITGGDAFYLFSDKQNRHQHISMLYVYDQSEMSEPVRFKTILDHVQERLSASPIFRQKLVEVPLNLDYPYWINDPDFDLEYHVRHIALPKPGDWRQFCIQVSRLHSRPLDMTRPVWEMYVIEGLDNVDFLPEGSFAILLKVHHVAVDGVSGAELSIALHDTEANPTTPRKKQRWRPSPPPNPAELLSRAVANNIRATRSTVGRLTGKLSHKVREIYTGEKAETWEVEPGAFTRFSQRISPHRVWDAARFELQDFKDIKQAVPGATINDVVLTICGGAMIRYLKSKNEEPDRSLTAMVPISVRDSSEMGSAGNKVHLANTSLRTKESDPLQRLALVSHEMKHVKAMNALGAREMVEMQEDMPAPTMLLAIKALAGAWGPGRQYREQFNMVVTNVPGPQEAQYLCGAKLAMFTGMAVISDQMGVSHAVTSYNGQLVISALSCRSMMPDPAFYADCLRSTFEELKSAALKSTAGNTKKRKKS